MNKKIMKKVVKIGLIIVFIIFILFVMNTIRKLIIIKGLQKNVSQYTASTNYHIKSMSNQENGIILTLNSYRKDNKKLFIIERIENGKTNVKIATYDNGKEKHTFFETPESKKASLDSHVIMVMNVYDYFGNQSNMQLICSCIGSKVENAEYKGKECYRIGSFPGAVSLSDANSDVSAVYIEKNTGLVLKTNFGTIDSEREYEFGTVQDEIFEEPDISQYELVEDL